MDPRWVGYFYCRKISIRATTVIPKTTTHVNLRIIRRVASESFWACAISASRISCACSKVTSIGGVVLYEKIWYGKYRAMRYAKKRVTSTDKASTSRLFKNHPNWSRARTQLSGLVSHLIDIRTYGWGFKEATKERNIRRGTQIQLFNQIKSISTEQKG